MTGANLAKADLCNTNLVNSAMNVAILEGVFLNNSSNLTGANLAQATIANANLTNANLTIT
ncbi:MAG: pentapeptide repeat-containing protein [Arsenophonus endosymbiont of Dermacentor nuttalli]